MTTETLGRGRYHVERPIGHGAMGAVLLARDTFLGRRVAVKVLAGHLAGDVAFRRRFLREARLAARLCHPNVVQVFDAGDEGGCPFLVMEYVESETVADRVARNDGFGPDEVVALAGQVAAALAHAHAQGIVHRDVKPHNVMFRPDGVAKLTDFGIARAMDDSGLTEIGTVLGTAPFMAPEQAAGRPVGPPADVYALGALLRHVGIGPLPPELAGLVEAALADDPAARPTAAEFHARLAGAAPAGGAGEFVPTVIREDGSTEVLLSPGGGAPARRDLWPGALIAVVAFAILLLALAVNLTASGRGHPTPAPTATSGAPAPAPAATDPAQAARDLSSWLRSQGR